MRRRPNPDSEPNIKRIDTKARAKKQTHGFQVHLLRGTEAVTKMFSDSVYGGKEAARKAARKFKRSAISSAPDRRPTGLVSARKGGSRKSAARSKGAARGRSGKTAGRRSR